MDRSERLAFNRGETADLPLVSPFLDWALVGAGTWLSFGSHLDGWAHNHIPELETFFTPWHGVLYSGFGAFVVVLAIALIRNHVPGQSWRSAIPFGYGPSYVGAAIFMLGGLGDMTWHELFGIEANVEALVSPTHLMLATGATLLFAGPFRSVWMRSGMRGNQLWPAVLSLAYVLSLLTFFSIIFHPLSRPWAAAGNHPIAGSIQLAQSFPNLPVDNGSGGLFTVREMALIIGLASFLIQGAMLSGIALLAVRRWGRSLPLGAFTVMFTINAMLTGFERDTMALAPIAFLGGAAADIMLRLLAPSRERLGRFRLFAFALPAVYFAIYFAALQLFGGTWWTLPLWTGSIVFGGAAGLMLSYLMVPPAVPAEAALVGSEDLDERRAA